MAVKKLRKGRRTRMQQMLLTVSAISLRLLGLGIPCYMYIREH